MSRILYNKRLLVLVFIAIAGFLLWSLPVAGGDDTVTHEDADDGHEGHDHGEASDAHAGHKHEDELSIELSSEAMKLAGILISTVA